MVKFIYASFSKCGTKTIAAVFRELGYKVHDYEESVIYTSKTWNAIFEHSNNQEKMSMENKIKILRDGLKDFDVVMDTPCHILWYEISLAFPDAKVIFYERPIDEWWPSFVKQIKSVQKVPTLPDFLKNRQIDWLMPSLKYYKADKTLFPLFYGHQVIPMKNWKGKNFTLDEIFV